MVKKVRVIPMGVKSFNVFSGEGQFCFQRENPDGTSGLLLDENKAKEFVFANPGRLTIQQTETVAETRASPVPASAFPAASGGASAQTGGNTPAS